MVSFNDAGPSPVDALLAEQRLMTPVAELARRHPAGGTGPGRPAPEPHYRRLVPLSRPGPGEQYAFEVDLDRCSACKSCVSACHHLNGLEGAESWRDVGLLLGGPPEEPFLQTVTTACHHCVEPACLEGCPVLAYEKDPVTGVVIHLDDQCIGCQYCVLKCPYDVPKYSASKGIVRKCDLCHGRLAEGEAPACVQSCPTEAIRVAVVEVEEARAAARRGEFLPGAPPPSYTVPTTRYLSRGAAPPDVRAADAGRPTPSPPHYPLVFMLVLTQLSVGAVAIDAITAGTSPALALGALAAGLAGLGASTLHLGRPAGAWRAFLGLRRSWLSREIVVFGLYAAVATTYAVLRWVGWHGPPAAPASVVGTLAAATGLAGVFCSAMIYHDTRRVFWALPVSGGRFFGTAAVLGCAAAWAVEATKVQPGAAAVFALAVLLAAPLKMVAEAQVLAAFDRGAPRVGGGLEAVHAGIARLHLGTLRGLTVARFALGAAGGFALPLVALVGDLPAPVEAGLATVALLLLTGGELLERTLFFRAVDTPKMPGGIAR